MCRCAAAAMLLAFVARGAGVLFGFGALLCFIILERALGLTSAGLK